MNKISSTRRAFVEQITSVAAALFVSPNCVFRTRAAASGTALDECVLGNPKYGLTGTYKRSGSIRFSERPTKEWEFMATGTGVTGLTVNFPEEMLLQINHATAIDEAGSLRALARLHLDLAGSPFVQAKSFSMEHDLRRSVIKAVADTDKGVVRVEVRAHVPLDIIRIDIDDNRHKPGKVSIRLEEDALSSVQFLQDTGLWLWHVNDACKIAPPKPQSSASGPEIVLGNHDWLAGRTFGMCLSPEQKASSIVSGSILQLQPAAHHTIYIACASTLNGYGSFANAVETRLAHVRRDRNSFVQTHEAWWKAFWERSCFEPGDQNGSMTRYKAAFDLYRYYLACCAGEDRETPVRFQIDLFRYHYRDFEWLTGLICAVEQYQSFYGAIRTGDWAPLRNLAAFYKLNLPYYRYCSQRMYGHTGARIPMWQTPQIIDPTIEPAPSQQLTGVPDSAYNGENAAGQLWMLLLMCDYVDITGDHEFARQTLYPLAYDLVEFVNLQYPRRENGRMVIAPCNAGETWQGVRDPAEMVCALRKTLPRLISIGRTEGWSEGLIGTWNELLTIVPEIPLGHLYYQGPGKLPVILAGDQLVPAADMSGCEAYEPGWTKGEPLYQLNSQHTELYAIWPAKMVLQDGASKEIALRSYHERLFQHLWDGWNLDVVFAACLGLQDEVAHWFGPHFDNTFVLPSGLARETAPENPNCPGLPDCPSLQGMGTGIIPVLEMLLQDYPDKVIVLPCWPENIPVSFTLYSPCAGRVEVRYRPGESLDVKLERPVNVSSPMQYSTMLKINSKK